MDWDPMAPLSWMNALKRGQMMMRNSLWMAQQIFSYPVQSGIASAQPAGWQLGLSFGKWKVFESSSGEEKMEPKLLSY